MIRLYESLSAEAVRKVRNKFYAWQQKVYKKIHVSESSVAMIKDQFA